MSDSRRADVSISFDGMDITADVRPYFLSLTYTDNEEDGADDFQLKLHDRDGIWLESWLNEAVQAAAAGKLKMSAVIHQKNWGGANTHWGDLPTGEFELDGVDASGPGTTINIKGTALGFSSPIRQTKKSKAWENYKLSGIAGEIASNGGLALMYDCGSDPSYERVEQNKKSDINFLSELCHDAGISLKCTDGQLVLFEQKAYESRPPTMTFVRGAWSYIGYDLSMGSADTQYGSCRVRYFDTASNQLIEGTYTAPGEDSESSQVLEVTARVKDVGEAVKLAEHRLRLHNKFTRTASFTVPGSFAMLAGSVVALEGWGGFDGNYIIKQAVHTVGKNGYTTKVNLRRALV